MKLVFNYMNIYKIWYDFQAVSVDIAPAESALTFWWIWFFVWSIKGTARTQSPTTKNYAPELSTFGIIARVSPTLVQWKGLALEKPPWGSGLSLCQVSMLFRPSLRQVIAPTSFFLTAASHSHFFLASSWIRFQSVFHWHVPIDLTQYYNVQIK